MIKTVIIPDLHFPFHSKRGIKICLEFIKEHKPQYVIQLGDLMDFFSFSRHLKNPHYIKPMDELNLARVCAEEMWDYIQKISPKSKCIQLGGNHCTGRLAKLSLEKAPELYELAVTKNKEIMTFKGVKTFHSQRDYFELDGVLYTHGTYTQPYKHVDHYNKSVIFGHLHRQFLVYSDRYNKSLFEMCCGHLADVENEDIFGYTQSKITKWTEGFGVIDEYGPRLIQIK